MAASTWTLRRADAARRLTEACSSLRQHPCELDALATVVALADLKLAVRPRGGRIEPDLRAEPTIGEDKLARELLELVARHATDHASSSRPAQVAAFGDWLEEHGFSRLSVALVGDRDAQRELKTVAEIVAASVRILSERSTLLALAHLQNVLDRDLPGVPFECFGLTPPAAWLLVVETSGRSDRAEVLERRRQALSIYGALSSTLFDPDVTTAIDRGVPLAPLLEARHDLKRAELRALREARRLRHSIEASTDFHVAIEELRAHEVPLHEWPGRGTPARPDAWTASVWHRQPRQNLVRPDYLGDQSSEVRDAMMRYATISFARSSPCGSGSAGSGPTGGSRASPARSSSAAPRAAASPVGA